MQGMFQHYQHVSPFPQIQLVPNGEDSTFLRNINKFISGYKASYHRTTVKFRTTIKFIQRQSSKYAREEMRLFINLQRDYNSELLGFRDDGNCQANRLFFPRDKIKAVSLKV
jgi:hypothetical protein